MKTVGKALLAASTSLVLAASVNAAALVKIGATTAPWGSTRTRSKWAWARPSVCEKQGLPAQRDVRRGRHAGGREGGQPQP